MVNEFFYSNKIIPNIILIDFVRFETRNDEHRSKITSETAGSTNSLKTSTKRQFFVR
jgi:hypothetical protein